ncbi:hypothetical protein F4808DRAFT_15850 [Astrocystis sublimbata]|nr:hypothetical protein F4808DRAFT_15850 [Astrocystis sublimbata]
METMESIDPMETIEPIEPSQQMTVSVRVRLRKSRHGCRTCKQRKIKCDEAKPVCGNCAKRYLDIESCEYPTVPSSRTRHSNRESSSSGSSHAGDASVVQLNSNMPAPSLTTRPTGASANPGQRQLEMRLMYHYTQFAALELPATYGYSSKELWLDKVPQMAFESDLLLDALLTLAAIHMNDLMPQDHKLEVAVNHYLDRTLTKHRYSLGTIDQSLAEPVFVTAFMLCITSWQLAHRRSATSSDTYRIPSSVFALVRGCCALHRQYDGWLSKAGYDPQAIYLDPQSNSSIQADHPLLHHIRQDLAMLLEAFHVDAMPTNEADVYRDTADCIIGLYVALCLGQTNTILQRLVFTMAVRMKPQYIAMLEAGEPLALVLYARILCVLGFIDHMWWSRGTNKRDVLKFSINGIVNAMPLRCSWAMEWPLKVVRGEVSMATMTSQLNQAAAGCES